MRFAAKDSVKRLFYQTRKKFYHRSRQQCGNNSSFPNAYNFEIKKYKRQHQGENYYSDKYKHDLNEIRFYGYKQYDFHSYIGKPPE